jgi:hypothetical protein
MQEIEDVIGEPAGLPDRQRLLQIREALYAVWANDDDFTVQICRPHR